MKIRFRFWIFCLFSWGFSPKYHPNVNIDRDKQDTRNTGTSDVARGTRSRVKVVLYYMHAQNFVNCKAQHSFQHRTTNESRSRNCNEWDFQSLWSKPAASKVWSLRSATCSVMSRAFPHKSNPNSTSFPVQIVVFGEFMKINDV